jgi:beta-glucosidase
MKTLVTVFAASLLATSASAQTPPYQNQSLPFETRVADLVGRMTLEEKVQQMKDVAPAIPRLGVPEYNWWNEALHGVARAGLATSFPQAIGMAATWNDSLMFRLATATSDEGRAKYHEYIRNNSHARYQGLTFWSPNINIFRDPRWGRGQETYGEDPFLTGKLGVQFIRGLQGDDPTYYKTVATVKHFAVHSGPEPERHEFDAVVSERDMRETYLPHFEMGIREGKAYSLMCAYNRVDGKAACASDFLIKDVLRGEWKFPGFIVSDCGAIDDIYLRHKVAPTAAAAAAMAVKSGTDLDCGRVYPSLAQAVREGLITEAEIDVSLKRLFLGRFKLGMFDSQDKVKWSKIPYSVLDNAAHKALARKVAQESMVLLKNQNNALPLSKNLKTLAVIGPNADQWRVMLGNYNGIPSAPITPLQGIRAAVSKNTKVLYALGAPLAEGFPVMATTPSSVLRTPDGRPGMRAEIFANRGLTGAPAITRTDTTVEVNWSEGAPRAGMNPDDFGVRWTGTFRAPQTGAYRFGAFTSLKVEIYLNDSLVTRSIQPNRGDEFQEARIAQSNPMRLEAGREYRVRIESHESYGDAQLQFVWSAPSETLAAEAEAVATQADAVVMFLGLTANLEGEEMRVQIPGFRGGDRTDIDLPAAQQALLERMVALGKPTVLVLMNGSAMAVNWAQANVPAILEAWYPGQAGGQAIADVLFGDYNPAGRLPVTFYKGVADLPPFEDYKMANRTYRFFKGAPLYAFGHGLSYTTFSYKNLRTSTEQVASRDTLTVRVDVTNTGRRAGDEVVQLYVAHVGSRVERPIKDLRGYQRVPLRPGQTRTVTFRVPVASLAYWNADTDAWVVEPGRVQLQVGASSADVRVNRTVSIRE